MKQLIHQKRAWLFLLLPISLFVSSMASQNSGWAEWYAMTIYPVLSKLINHISSLFPFSLMEIILIAGIVGVLFFIVRLAVRLIQKPQERKTNLVRAAASLLCALGLISFLFTLTCGINYSRHTFAQVSGLPIQPSSREELKDLCTELVQQANRLRPKVTTDHQGVTHLEDWTQAAQTAQTTMNAMEQKYPTLKSGYGTPKPVALSRLMSYCNITGVYFPFTMEANVNKDAPDYGIPATMLHELSHLRGYMREDEANFIAYLACRSSDNPLFQYSGTVLAFSYANNALYSVDADSSREIYSLLSEDVQRDFAAEKAYWKQFEGPVANTASKVNDSYLKSNRQEDGVKSYGRMVDLLLAEFRQQHTEP